MRITTRTLSLVLAAVLNSIGISSGAPPKTRDFLTNFGMSNETGNHQEMSTGFLPRTRDFLKNFGTSDINENREDSNSRSQCLPDSELVLGVPRREPPDSPDGHFSANAQTPAEPALRARSRSPAAQRGNMDPPYRIVSSNGTTYGLDELQFIRVIPYKNSHQIFELRKYTFPANTPIRLLATRHVYVPMPMEEQIVLSTSGGDIYAILENSAAFSGIYTYKSSSHHRARAKMNMESGIITLLTPHEIMETPVGSMRPMLLFFRVEHVNFDLLRQ